MIEDKLYKYLKFYKKSPFALRKAVGSIYKTLPNSIRYGEDHRYHTNLLRSSKSWSEERIQEFQLHSLNDLLKIAKSKTPFYTRHYSKLSLPIRSLREFKETVPTISKDDLRTQSDLFLNSDIKKSDLIELSTGGTTGEPLKLYYPKGGSRTKELVYMNDQWSRIGYQPNDSRVTFRSSLVRDRATENLWDHDPIKNRYFFSTFDLTEENILKHIEKLRQIKPKFLHVYPSALTIIAGYMKKHEIEPIESIKGVLSGSENTYPHQIKLFKDVLKCEVCRWYGLGEMSALAGSCEHSYDYHCYPTYSYTELLDENANPVEKEGEIGEIVGTTFDNTSMPLIRYRTGDFAQFGGTRCNKCNRYGLLFKEIEGRKQEFIIDSQDNIFSLGPFIFGIHDSLWSDVSGIQFVQKEKGKLELYAASMTLSESELTTYLSKLFLPRFSGNFELEVFPVPKIAKSAAGKHRFLIQHIDLETVKK